MCVSRLTDLSPVTDMVVGEARAPVLAPLLVSSALLVLMQLYLAIPLAPVVGEQPSGTDAAAAVAVAVALGTTYSLADALGFLIFGPCPTGTGASRSWCRGWRR